MADSVRVKRGIRSNLPKSLPLGELAFCTDTGELFVGAGEGLSLKKVVDPYVLQKVRELVLELTTKSSKKDIKSLQAQINNLVLGAVGDGNNAEVIQARGIHPTLNDRFDAIRRGYELDNNIIQERHISNSIGTPTPSQKIRVDKTNGYEQCVPLMLTYNIPSTSIKSISFSCDATSVLNMKQICIKVGLIRPDANLVISTKYDFDGFIHLNEDFTWSNKVETTNVYVHVWGMASDTINPAEFYASNFILSINDNVVTTPPKYGYYATGGLGKVEVGYYEVPCLLAKYSYVHDVEERVSDIENTIQNLPSDTIVVKEPDEFSYITGTKKFGVSQLCYCNTHVFNEDLTIHKLTMLMEATELGEQSLKYFVINSNMQIIERGVLHHSVTLIGTHKILFDSLNIQLPKGSYLAFQYVTQTFRPTYDDTTPFVIRSVSISNKATFQQTVSGGLNYALHYSKNTSLTNRLNNLVTKESLNNVLNTLVTQEYFNSIMQDVLTRNSRLYGKKIVAIGDSMVQGHSIAKDKGWLAMIAQRNNMTYVNYGINGTFMTNKLYDNHKGIIDRYVNMDNDADYVVIFAGTNDAAANVTIGENNSNNPSEFKGALNLLCQGLLTKYPKGKILFISPYLRNENYRKYVQALHDICEDKYSIKVHDNIKHGGICWNNQAQVEALTLKDTLHLNLVGMEYASYKYEETLKTL